jgi:hypothetical protein
MYFNEDSTIFQKQQNSEDKDIIQFQIVKNFNP